jgi:hypothetical protein
MTSLEIGTMNQIYQFSTLVSIHILDYLSYMKKMGPDFYDTKEVFNYYIAHRSDPNTPNETIELLNK